MCAPPIPQTWLRSASQVSTSDGADGNLESWWTPDVREAVDSRTQCLGDQYTGFAVNGEHENGNLTLGENMADNGGLHVSFRAYNDWLESENGGQLVVAVDWFC